MDMLILCIRGAGAELRCKKRLTAYHVSSEELNQNPRPNRGLRLR